MKRKPLKRTQALQPLSREHHQGLLLCWKIRKGLGTGVDPCRIKAYVDWFYENYLFTHFHQEEQFVFPLLGNEHELVRKALTEHRRLNRLFSQKEDLTRNLSRIEEELEQHIRFEERVLFEEIQRTVSTEQLQSLELSHQETGFQENNSDPFWL
ncbi:MAG: hemerythrin domain-containing protein [Bacteroidota bacterium]|jgi:iron-sulfur cluster repair protein YtfE (RIC family)|uniref:Hemerythrin-like domain-containing protein n=2 Tax=Roseivirga TaxID=290180 RepID=A0ABQ3I0C5_9BACT|nr:hemerythrin domain-containing protein [Roseivirga thermotolerans]MEC7752992.1 hemerythrin domain-containing protein [Bacteroidota bacterium]GHE52673.1 hypothetical protein GCM10011340_03770 [Roseivirga thermotolerans]